jgi:hypothetical protein
MLEVETLQNDRVPWYFEKMSKMNLIRAVTFEGVQLSEI